MEPWVMDEENSVSAMHEHRELGAGHIVSFATDLELSQS